MIVGSISAVHIAYWLYRESVGCMHIHGNYSKDIDAVMSHPDVNIVLSVNKARFPLLTARVNGPS